MIRSVPRGPGRRSPPGVARALLVSQYALMLEYRAEIVLWALSGVLPLIMLGVWSGSGAGAGAGLSPQQISRYFLSAFLVRQFTVVWLIHVFEEDALQGRLSPFLLQPLAPLWRYLAAHFSEQASRVPIVAVMLLALGLVAAIGALLTAGPSGDPGSLPAPFPAPGGSHNPLFLE